jgi:hypothetical protein
MHHELTETGRVCRSFIKLAKQGSGKLLGLLADRWRSMKRAALRSGSILLGGLHQVPTLALAALIAALVKASVYRSAPLAGEMAKLLD